MGTVVITFFLITRLYVCKMDADFKEKPRERISSRREKRWSMNSQRLEEIVAELMRPMRDLRHCFDTDLSALLEEYLTEAGLHALEAEDEVAEGAPREPPPNFAELALLLQQSANIYGRKVDALYQHVLSISDSLDNTFSEMARRSVAEAGEGGEAEAGEAATPSRSRRKRKASVLPCGEFSYIQLEAAASARREPGAARPPPTLPRMYIELEPRVLADGDVPLLDYGGEPIGLLADFQVNMRLQEGLLVEELAGAAAAGALRPLPLLELQAAIEAAAPPSPPPLREDSPPPDALPAPPHCSTPLPLPLPPDTDMPPPPAPLKRERKRRNDANIDDLVGGTIKLLISMKLRRILKHSVEFGVCPSWVSRVVRGRRDYILTLRRRLADGGDLPDLPDLLAPLNGNGFPGWTPSEAQAAGAAAAAARARAERLADDSDDDGFFEQSEHSSLGDCDHSRPDDAALHTQLPAVQAAAAAAAGAAGADAEALEWAAWRARLAARAAAGEARGPLDVRALAAAVLAALPADDGPRPFTHVLARTAKEETDVSHLFLATLFLANAGNVEVVQGAPLSLNSFSLRLLSADARLYCAAAAAEPPPPPR